MRIAASGKSTLLSSKSSTSGVERCFNPSADRGGDVCQVDVAEQRVGLLSQLLLDMGSIAVGTTLTDFAVVSVKQGTHVSQCLAAMAHAFPQSFKAGMKLLLARVGRAFVHVSPRVQPPLADSSRASRRSVHFGKSV